MLVDNAVTPIVAAGHVPRARRSASRATARPGRLKARAGARRARRTDGRHGEPGRGLLRLRSRDRLFRRRDRRQISPHVDGSQTSLPAELSPCSAKACGRARSLDPRHSRQVLFMHNRRRTRTRGHLALRARHRRPLGPAPSRACVSPSPPLAQKTPPPHKHCAHGSAVEDCRPPSPRPLQTEPRDGSRESRARDSGRRDQRTRTARRRVPRPRA